MKLTKQISRQASTPNLAIQLIIKLFEIDDQFIYQNEVSRLMPQSHSSEKTLRTIKSLSCLLQDKRFYSTSKQPILNYFKTIKQQDMNSSRGTQDNLLQKMTSLLSQAYCKFQHSDHILLALTEATENINLKTQYSLQLTLLRPNQIEYAFRYANSLYLMGDYSKAQQVLNNGLSLLKESPSKDKLLYSKIYYLKGLAYKSSIKYKNSLICLNLAIKYDRYNIKAYKEIVIILMGQQNYKATQSIIKLYRQSFKNSTLFIAVQIIIRFSQNQKNALQLYDSQFGLIPTDHQFCLYFLCIAIKKYYELKFQQCYQYITKELKRDRKNIIVLKWASKCSFRMQYYHRSLFYHQRLRVVLKMKSEVILDIATDYLAMGQRQKAKAMVKLIEDKMSCKQYCYPISTIMKLLQLSSKLNIGNFDDHYQAVKLGNSTRQELIQIQINIIELINQEANHKYQKSYILLKIIENSLAQYSLGNYLFQHFHILYFVLQYKFRKQIFDNNNYLIEKMRKVIQTVGQFNETGAEVLQKHLRMRQPSKIELLFV